MVCELYLNKAIREKGVEKTITSFSKNRGEKSSRDQAHSVKQETGREGKGGGHGPRLLGEQKCSGRSQLRAASKQ